MIKAKNSKYSYIELIISCTLFGTSGIFLNYIYGMKTTSVLFYRLVFGLALLLVYCIITKRYNMLFISRKKRYILLIGVCNVLTLYSYFSSIKYAGISIAVLLLYTAPVYVTLLSPIFLKDKITKKGMLSLMISIIGILLVILPGNETSGHDARLLIGVAFGIFSGFTYSGTIMTVSYLKGEYSGFTQLFWSSLISLLILLPFGVQIPTAILVPNLPVLVLFGLVTTSLASVLYLNSASRIRAQTVSVVALLEPVSGIFCGFIFLNEPIFINTIQGCLFILLGAFILVFEPGSKGIFSVEKRFDIAGMISGQRFLKIPGISFGRFRKW